jgi:hypothetical protein
MKKFLILFCLSISSLSVVFSQTLTLDDAFRVLDEDFAKYPYVHQIEAARTDDSRAQSVKITRLPYKYDVDDQGNTMQAEKVYITIIRGGYRYRMVFDFLPRPEGQSLRSSDVKSRTYGALLADLRARQQAAQQESSAPAAGGE